MNASGARAQLAYVLESVYGTTPATPTLLVLPDSRNSVGLTKETFESERIRSDRQVTDFRHGVRTVDGEIPFELCSANYDDLLQAVLMGTWTADVLKAGTTRRSFTLETHFQDINKYIRSVGCEFNTLALEITPGAMVNGTLGVVGQNAVSAAAAVAGSSYTPAPITHIFDGFGGSLSIGGVTVAVVTSLSLSLENNIENQPVVGVGTTVQGAAGRSVLTGEVSAFFEDVTLFDHFSDEDEVEIDFDLTLPAGVSGNEYNFNLPRVKLNGGKPEVGDEREVTLSIPFQALYDSTAQSQIVITRTVVP